MGLPGRHPAKGTTPAPWDVLDSAIVVHHCARPMGLGLGWVRKVMQGSSDMGKIARWGRGIIRVKGSEGGRVGVEVSQSCMQNLEVVMSDAPVCASS